MTWGEVRELPCAFPSSSFQLLPSSAQTLTGAPYTIRPASSVEAPGLGGRIGPRGSPQATGRRVVLLSAVSTGPSREKTNVTRACSSNLTPACRLQEALSEHPPGPQALAVPRRAPATVPGQRGEAGEVNAARAAPPPSVRSAGPGW